MSGCSGAASAPDGGDAASSDPDGSQPVDASGENDSSAPSDAGAGDAALKPICQGIMPESYTTVPSADSFILDTVVELRWDAIQTTDADAGASAFPASAWKPLDTALADGAVHACACASSRASTHPCS